MGVVDCSAIVEKVAFIPEQSDSGAWSGTGQSSLGHACRTGIAAHTLFTLDSN
jgi:hypothetical protein